MNPSQHYQPLSHALNPTPSHPRSPPYNSYGDQHHHDLLADTINSTNTRREEEEEEEEEEEDEIDLNLSGHSNIVSGDSPNDGSRRKPGRPKGSKNKRPRFDLGASTPSKQQYGSPGQFLQYAANQPSTIPMQPHPPPHPTLPPAPAPVSAPAPAPVPPSTETASPQFYDFQWRVLHLCSEFYKAADELISGAPPHVISQCFNLTGGQMDPIRILNDARRACDSLMQQPSNSVLKPPPAPAPIPALPIFPIDVSQNKSTPQTVAPSDVITNPASFVMSLGTAMPYPPPAGRYPTNSRYPTTPYYQYTPGAPTYLVHQQTIKPVSLSTPASAGNQGAWSDEETEKLKKLAEESKAKGNGLGEIDWDHVCNAWGAGRTRHQILIKATNLGMKESSTRTNKRRRETDSGPGLDDNPHSTASPANLQQPSRPSSAANVNANANVNAWQTPLQQSAARSNYYRDRPTQSPNIASVSPPGPGHPAAFFQNGTAQTSEGLA